MVTGGFKTYYRNCKVLYLTTNIGICLFLWWWGGDNNNDTARLSNIISRRSTCLTIQPKNLLPVFSNSDNVKKHNEKMWFTSQDYESEEEDDLESSLYHNFFGMHSYMGVFINLKQAFDNLLFIIYRGRWRL